MASLVYTPVSVQMLPNHGFNGPESVCCDRDQGVFFVPNFNGVRDRDAYGFVTKISPDDGTLQLKV